jgi:Xaa-Pro aminopeptidase
VSVDGKAEIFRARRDRFIKAIGEGAVAILPAAPVSVRSNDVEVVYRPDNDFYYLTGFAEPESAALFAPGHPEGEFVLFVLPRDKERETWTGRRAGVEGAMTDYGADKAYTIEEFDRIVQSYLEKASRLHYPLGRSERMNDRVLAMFRNSQAARPRTGEGPCAILDPREIIHEARLKKEPYELEMMRCAIAISAEAHRRAMREARGGMMEWEIEAALNYVFRKNGAAGPAYPSIVASGPPT